MSCMKLLWTAEHVTCLIDEYQKYPCLYAVKNMLYHNRNARADALQKICSVLRVIRPGTSVEEVKNKFSSLRTTYLSEKRKYESAKKSGASGDFEYLPSLWYYNLMHFLDNHVTTRPSKSNIQFNEPDPDTAASQNQLSSIIQSSSSNGPVYNSEVEEANDSLDLDNSTVQTVDVDNSQVIEEDVVFDHDYTEITPSRPERKKKRKSENADGQDVLKEATKALQGISNAIVHNPPQVEPKPLPSAEDLYGQLVAARLKLITDQKKRFRAQQEVDNVLYKYILDD